MPLHGGVLDRGGRLAAAVVRRRQRRLRDCVPCRKWPKPHQALQRRRCARQRERERER
jgi:hypothetical protein